MVTEVLSRVGQVLSFRLVLDKEVGKPKGFGFAEFADVDAAQSAIRNLNDFEFMGRPLRVDYPNDGTAPFPDASGGPAGSNSAPAGSGAGAAAGGSKSISSTTLPPFPPGVPVAPDTTSIDVISQTLKQIKLPQLLDIIKDVKTLVHKEPLKATELFRQAPQLSYAVFQCLLLMGLVDPADLTSILANQPIGANAAGGAANDRGTGQGPASQQVPPSGPAAMSTGPAAGPAPALTQQQLIEQVMSLTPQQIELLPPNDRAHIEELKRQIAAGAFR